MASSRGSHLAGSKENRKVERKRAEKPVKAVRREETVPPEREETVQAERKTVKDVSGENRRVQKHGSVFGRILLVLLALCFAMGVIGLGTALIITHGPSEQAKVLFIRTFKDTGTVQWVPELFLPAEEVERLTKPVTEVGGKKYTLERDAAVTEVVFEPIPEDEEMITLSDISGTSWHGKMLIVRDPKLVTLAIPEPVGNGAYGSFMQVEDFVELYGAVAGITAGGFYMEEGLPFGIIIKDGKVVSSVDGERGGIIGFTKEHKLVLGYMTKEQAAEKGIVEAICWQPYLILNGIKQTDLGGGYNPRAAIGQRADGAIVLVLIEGRMVSSLGATYDDLADFMEAQGCINAANLDSGRSSVMVYEGKQITKVAVGAGIQTVDRLIPNAFVVMPEGWTEDD